MVTDPPQPSRPISRRFSHENVGSTISPRRRRIKERPKAEVTDIRTAANRLEVIAAHEAGSPALLTLHNNLELGEKASHYHRLWLNAKKENENTQRENYFMECLLQEEQNKTRKLEGMVKQFDDEFEALKINASSLRDVLAQMDLVYLHVDTLSQSLAGVVSSVCFREMEKPQILQTALDYLYPTRTLDTRLNSLYASVYFHKARFKGQKRDAPVPPPGPLPVAVSDGKSEWLPPNVLLSYAEESPLVPKVMIHESLQTETEHVVKQDHGVDPVIFPDLEGDILDLEQLRKRIDERLEAESMVEMAKRRREQLREQAIKLLGRNSSQNGSDASGVEGEKLGSDIELSQSLSNSQRDIPGITTTGIARNVSREEIRADRRRSLDSSVGPSSSSEEYEDWPVLTAAMKATKKGPGGLKAGTGKIQMGKKQAIKIKTKTNVTEGANNKVKASIPNISPSVGVKQPVLKEKEPETATPVKKTLPSGNGPMKVKVNAGSTKAPAVKTDDSLVKIADGVSLTPKVAAVGKKIVVKRKINVKKRL